MLDPYWEERGEKTYRYRGEEFCTVTPIPMYYERRRILVRLLEPYIGAASVRRICDFGCGDGYYLARFSRRFVGKDWVGIDVAQSMIEQTIRACPVAKYYVSKNGIEEGESFGLRLFRCCPCSHH